MKSLVCPVLVSRCLASTLVRCAAVFFCGVTIVGSITTAQAQSSLPEWSQFQNGGRPVVNGDSLPSAWSPDQNIAWQSPIKGYGQSTPVVAGEQVYVTSVSGDQRQQYHLTAFALSSGEELWRKDFDNPTPKEDTPMTSRAAPSAVADADGCIAFFEGGVVVSVDQQGAIRWERDLIGEYGPVDARHGVAASLEHNDDNVFVWVERSESPYVLAIDKKSGENVWKVDGVGATSWASPRLIATDKGDHLVCSASGKIVGFDPQTGSRLWDFDEIANNTSCTPVPAGDGRFLIGASDGRGETTSGSGAQYNGVIEIRPDGDAYDVSFLWHAEKASSSFGSPVVAQDTVCIVNRAGVLYQLDLNTGERVATSRTTAGGIWATPIVSGDRLYLFGYKGTTSVISLSDGKEVASNRLWEAAKAESRPGGGGVLYAAAAVPPYLIMRRGDALFAVVNQD